MSGINTGILTNACPLSTEHVKELEKRVLESKDTIAYLNENCELCFAAPHVGDDIKDLAWHKAFALYNEDGTFTKKVYDRTGLKTFEHKTTLTKQYIDDPWVGPESTAGLYQTGSNYTVLLKSWDELVSSGAIVVNNGVVYRGAIMPDLPEKNEYGFYYGVQYVYGDDGYVYNEDGSIEFYYAGSPDGSMPAGSAVYGPYSITISEWGSVFSVSADGTELTDGYGTMAISEMPAQLPGDLMLPTDGSVTQLGDYRWDDSVYNEEWDEYGDYVGNVAFAGCTSLTGIKIPDSVIRISDYAFSECANLSDMIYVGERAEFKNGISFGVDWYYNSMLSFVHCADGNIYLGDIQTPTGLALSEHKIISFDLVENAVKYEITINDNSSFFITDNTLDISNQISIDLSDPILVKIRAFGNENDFTGSHISEMTVSLFNPLPGLYDSNWNLVTSWDTLVNTYGMDATKKYVAYNSPDNYKTNTTSPYYILTNIAALANGSKLVVGDDIDIIGDYTFCDCTNLTSINIPNGVTSIGKMAFSNCTSLTNIDIPDSVTSIGDWAFDGCTGLTSIVIPDSVTSIDDYAFHDCTNLTSIEIPDSVTSIEYGTFQRCTNLTSIKIPDSVTSIGSSAFSGSGLTNVTIPDSVTSIGSSAFNNCTSLTSVTIPDSMTSIGDYAFSSCINLKTVYYEGTLEQWCKFVFSSKTNPCGNGADLYIGGVKQIDITIPDTITSINDYTFYQCESLTNVTIPDSVTSIGSSAFSNCTNLTSINIHNGVTIIGSYAFSGSGLTSVAIPDTITSINDYTFYQCESLTNVTIPDSVTSIGSSAFSFCYNLKTITIEATTHPTLSYNVFAGCSLTAIYVPAESVDEYKTANRWSGYADLIQPIPTT